jgi:hypothetical protein
VHQLKALKGYVDQDTWYLIEEEIDSREWEEAEERRYQERFRDHTESDRMAAESERLSNLANEY